MVSTSDSEMLPVSNRRATIIGVTISFQILAFFAVLFRLYARVKLLKRTGWDDGFMVAALLMAALGTTTLSLCADNGLGQHIYDLSQSEIQTYLKLFYVTNGAYVMSTGFIKLSILCQYLRVFELRSARKICYFLLACTALWWAVYSFMAWFPCFPIHAYWDLSVTHYTCYGYGSRNSRDFVDTYLIQGSLDVALDIAIYLIPIPIFARQRLHKRSRAAFIALFSLGLLVCILSTYRLGTLIDHRNVMNNDWSYYSPITDILSTLEVNMAIIAASIPIFWPIVEAGLGVINITQEVHVTHHQYRRHSDEGEEMEQGSGGGTSTQETGSEAELKRKESSSSYRDTFVSFEPVDGSKIWSTTHIETAKPTSKGFNS